MLFCFVIKTKFKSWIWKMDIILESIVEKVHKLIMCAAINYQVDNLHHYQVDVFKTVNDMYLQESNHRFNEVNTNLLLCIAYLCQGESFKAFDLHKIMEKTTLYSEEFLA
uniref:Uncharacterized protein n=1 Tax=Lactuca sativa TaxID=4236 RepID=A0A9R1X389_LACSA|nr:hypothetical protein LSAT_V11C800414790 [Lactuca sativa]